VKVEGDEIVRLVEIEGSGRGIALAFLGLLGKILRRMANGFCFLESDILWIIGKPLLESRYEVRISQMYAFSAKLRYQSGWWLLSATRLIEVDSTLSHSII